MRILHDRHGATVIEYGLIAALIALLKRDSIDAPHLVAETLQQFAKEARMDFFCLSTLSNRVPDAEFLMTT